MELISAYEPYRQINGWDKDDNGLSNQALAQSITTAGSAIGALLAGPLMGYGLWKCILISNIFVMVGAGLTLIPNF